MSDIPIVAAKGSCIDKQFAFQDSAGTPLDMTGVILAVADAYPAVLATAELEWSDAAAGKAAFHVPAAVSAQLRTGKINRFRVQRTFADGCKKHSYPIWIEIR